MSDVDVKWARDYISQYREAAATRDWSWANSMAEKLAELAIQLGEREQEAWDQERVEAEERLARFEATLTGKVRSW
jgi:hypothetical protein